MSNKDMHILFTDQAEYYFVCSNCYDQFGDMQWSGSTRSFPEWRQVARSELREHMRLKKDCQFCGKNGNGGWMINGEFPAMKRRDGKKSNE